MHQIIAMSQPDRRTVWNDLFELGFRSVLRLSEESQPYDPAPLRLLGEVALEDQYEEEQPTNGPTQENRVNQAVHLLREGLQAGGVVVHCVGGRGRTGTVIGGFIHAMGVPHEDILKLLNTAYRDAGRPGWPESPWQGEVIGRIMF